MNKTLTTLLTLVILTAGFHAPPAQAYFKTIEGLTNLNKQHVVPSKYYDIQKPLFRTQRGRSKPSYPTTGNYSTRPKTSSVASDKQASNNIRSLFGRVNMSQNNQNPRYDNDQYNDSKIKFRSLVTHTCFEPAGSEINRCKKRFGTFYNLKESILNGNVYTILVTNNPNISNNITELYKKMHAEIKGNDALPIASESEKSTLLLRDRMQLVWDACKIKTADHREAARCYLLNNRLYLDNSLFSLNPNFLQ